MTSAQASDDVGSIVEPTSSLAWADVILADFQRVISRYLQNISIYFFYTAERMLRTIIMQNSKLIQACFPIKIDEVWIDRFCVCYDWLRRPAADVTDVISVPSVLLVSWQLAASGPWWSVVLLKLSLRCVFVNKDYISSFIIYINTPYITTVSYINGAQR